jgi:hypothetical protein
VSYTRLTPLRAFNLLEEVNDATTTDSWKLKQVRRALSEHVRAYLVTKPRKHSRKKKTT